MKPEQLEIERLRREGLPIETETAPIGGAAYDAAGAPLPEHCQVTGTLEPHVGDPNNREWSTSDFERRHVIVTTATLVGELFDKQVQAYPRYGSEKKGLPTTYYLTIADFELANLAGSRAWRAEIALRT